jgi:putative RecB family exonuclease
MSFSPTISHSYSRLSTFEQCNAKYDYLYVTRSVKDTDNEFTLYGSRVHEGLEIAGRTAMGEDGYGPVVPDTDHPVEVQPYLELIRRITAQPGEKLFELQVAITREFKPCEWMAADVWLRGILDVLVLKPPRAWVFDWKTGKIRDNPTQLQLFAALVFTLYPQIHEVRAAFVWLGHDHITDSVFHRRDAWRLWEGLTARFQKVQDAVDLGVFKPRPSALCRWCAARHICPSAKR